VALLIIKEPDLGTAIVIVLTMFSMFFAAGGKMRHVALLAIGSTSIAWALMMRTPYETARFTAFVNPWQHPDTVGYHTIQALLALGSGGSIGVGLGNSVQKYVLPAPHTDSILAVIGEETGLVGTVAVLVLFMIVAYRGTRIAMEAPDRFGRLLAMGITSWITFQALLNFAVITSSVPFTGVPLPLISYGGSSLALTMAGVGILLNISQHATRKAREEDDRDHGRGERRARLPRPGGRAQPARITQFKQRPDIS
jgi:cell division protein FtsW